MEKQTEEYVPGSLHCIYAKETVNSKNLLFQLVWTQHTMLTSGLVLSLLKCSAILLLYTRPLVDCFEGV